MSENIIFNDLTLSSSFEEINRLEAYLNTIREQAKLDDEQFSRIQLAVNEAVTNAVIHGNKEDATKKVEVNAALHDEVLTFTVTDEGPGFDPESVPDPLEEENLLKDSGRGVFLIKQYADEVEYSENGTKITMRFELDDSDE